jgi:hypothetical protein
MPTNLSLLCRVQPSTPAEIPVRDPQPCNRAYVDYDRVAVLQAEAILNDGGLVTVIEGDIRNPADVTAKVTRTRLIDFRQPVGVLMFAILHFITDDEKPGIKHLRMQGFQARESGRLRRDLPGRR